MYCTHCGIANLDIAGFCRSCGKSIAQHSVTVADLPLHAVPQGPAPTTAPVTSPALFPLFQRKQGVWIRIVDVDSAAVAAKQGAYAALTITVIATLIASISVATGQPVLGINASGFVDAAFTAITGWRIWRMSRVWACIGLAYWFLDMGAKVATAPSGFGVFAVFGVVPLVLLVGFVNGVRGTFAYARFTRKLAMHCSKCGNLLAEGDVFCGQCGTRAVSDVGALAPLTRPRVVTLLAVLQFIGSAVFLLIGVGLLGSLPYLSKADPAVVAVVGFLFAAMGVYSLVCGIGLMRLRKYAHTMEIIESVLGLLAFPIGTIISIAVLVYLSKPGIKVLFSEKRPEELSSEEIAQVNSLSQGKGSPKKVPYEQTANTQNRSEEPQH